MLFLVCGSRSSCHRFLGLPFSTTVLTIFSLRFDMRILFMSAANNYKIQHPPKFLGLHSLCECSGKNLILEITYGLKYLAISAFLYISPKTWAGKGLAAAISSSAARNCRPSPLQLARRAELNKKFLFGTGVIVKTKPGDADKSRVKYQFVSRRNGAVIRPGVAAGIMRVEADPERND